MKIYKIANIKTAALNISYTGVVSPDTLRSGTEQPWSDLFMATNIPEGWNKYASHMTINLGQAKDPKMLNQNVTLTIKALGKGEGVIALLVESSLTSKNESPHITLATAPNVQPSASNGITDWQPIIPFSITGTVCEVDMRGNVVTDEARNQEQERVEQEQEAKKQKELEKRRQREEENKNLQGMGFEGAKQYLQQQFPHLPEQAILGKLKGAGLQP